MKFRIQFPTDMAVLLFAVPCIVGIIGLMAWTALPVFNWVLKYWHH